jgi:hypothetical protein
MDPKLGTIRWLDLVEFVDEESEEEIDDPELLETESIDRGNSDHHEADEAASDTSNTSDTSTLSEESEEGEENSGERAESVVTSKDSN